MDEYIKREAVIDLITRRYENPEICTQEINSIPAADVAPVVHGRIIRLLEDGRYRRRFSCCGEDATIITQWAWPKYCPNCGAKMDGGADNA